MTLVFLLKAPNSGSSPFKHCQGHNGPVGRVVLLNYLFRGQVTKVDKRSNFRISTKFQLQNLNNGYTSNIYSNSRRLELKISGKPTLVRRLEKRVSSIFIVLTKTCKPTNNYSPKYTHYKEWLPHSLLQNFGTLRQNWDFIGTILGLRSQLDM